MPVSAISPPAAFAVRCRRRPEDEEGKWRRRIGQREEGPLRICVKHHAEDGQHCGQDHVREHGHDEDRMRKERKAWFETPYRARQAIAASGARTASRGTCPGLRSPGQRKRGQESIAQARTNGMIQVDRGVIAMMGSPASRPSGSDGAEPRPQEPGPGSAIALRHQRARFV